MNKLEQAVSWAISSNVGTTLVVGHDESNPKWVDLTVGQQAIPLTLDEAQWLAGALDEAVGHGMAVEHAEKATHHRD